MTRLRQVSVSLVSAGFLLAGCDGSRTSSSGPCGDEGGCAARNEEPVPDVVGRGPDEACRILESRNYGGVLRASNGSRPALVTAQNPTPGFVGGYGQGVRLTVSGPVSLSDIPRGRNCTLVSSVGQDGTSSGTPPLIVIYGTMLPVSLHLEQEVRTDEAEGGLTGRGHRRSDTPGVRSPGRRSPTPDRIGFAGPNIRALFRPSRAPHQGSKPPILLRVT